MSRGGIDEVATAIQESRNGPVLDGLYLRVFPHSVINLAGRERKLEAADVQTMRLAVEIIGLTVVDEWLAEQNVSWMSDGVFAGVSFRLTEGA